MTLCNHLLGQYHINAPHVNHYMISLLERMGQHILHFGNNDNDDSAYKNNEYEDTSTTTTTYQPMLYNIQFFHVLNRILNDGTIRYDPTY